MDMRLTKAQFKNYNYFELCDKQSNVVESPNKNKKMKVTMNESTIFT